MDKHLYCCQNALQNFLDHFILVPDDFVVNPQCLCGVEKRDFIDGLKKLTDILRAVYADMIENPAAYGLPLIEDIDYSVFNPKAAESKNSAHRLVSLLHTLVQCGELSAQCGEIIVDARSFSEASKKLKPMYKISNYKMILEKLGEFGLVYEDSVLSYPENKNVIPALYGYMKNNALKGNPIFSLNYFLAAEVRPSKPEIFAGYLSGEEREFFEKLRKFLNGEGYVVGSAPGYRDFAVEYVVDAKSEKRILRCYSDYGKLRVELKLHSSGCYTEYTEKMPEEIKRMFRKKSGCIACREPCKMRLVRTFEGITYTDCGYWNGLDIPSYNVEDIGYYADIIRLEMKAEKTSARRKGIKVSI